MKLQFAVQTTWLFTLCFVRLSVACSLLRFGTDLWWKWTLYALMSIQVLISSSYVVIQFGQCKPVSANWEFVEHVSCWDVQKIVNYGWAVAAFYVAMDLTLSLMPIKLILTLNRSKSEKVLIGCLMALGLAATAVAGAKMTTYNSFGTGDPMQATIPPSMYAKLEEIVGIIVSCLPPLKSSVEKLLRNMGILKEHQLRRPSFVNTAASLPERPQDRGQWSSSEGSIPNIKDAIRIDSVSLKHTDGSSKPGSSNSNNQSGPSPKKEPWECV